jgi:hypothetical protein
MCWSLLRFPLRLVAWSEGPKEQANPDGTWMAHAPSAWEKTPCELRKHLCPRHDSKVRAGGDVRFREVAVTGRAQVA